MTPLIDPEFGARLAGAGLPVVSAVPDYVRDKQPESTIVAYRFELDDGSWTRGYAHRCVDSRRVERIHHKAARLRPGTTDLGHGVFRLDPHTVVYGFPTDARLRRLRWYTTPRKLKRSLAPLFDGIKRGSSIEVLRYKPERRMVARMTLATRRRAATGRRPLLDECGGRSPGPPGPGRCEPVVWPARSHSVSSRPVVSRSTASWTAGNWSTSCATVVVTPLTWPIGCTISIGSPHHPVPGCGPDPMTSSESTAD